MLTKVKTPDELAAIRISGRMLATVLKALPPHVVPGISTKELADIAAKELKALGGQPTFLGYHGFPDVICISVNEQIVHGIPNTELFIRDGDLVSLDFGVTYNGMITDGAITVGSGRLKAEHQKLLDTTRGSLRAGIRVVRAGVQTGDISSAIQTIIEKAGPYGIPKDLVGHGVGHHLWEDPNISNFGRAKTGPQLAAGMTVAIEPMVTLGTDRIAMLDDGWTIVTADGSWAAHFEHTVLVTEQGAEILTK